MSPLAQQLFICFSDGEIHSGTKLAEKFQVTRQGIWKALNELKAYGLIESKGRQGYQARYAYDLLNREQIYQYLNPQYYHQIDEFMIQCVTGSTNDDVSILKANYAAVVLSEMQTRGKGRQGRQWYVSPASSLCFSMKVYFKQQALANLTSFSPALGVYVVKMLREFGIPAHVKWPNDIWVDHLKLGGILIELHANSETDVEMVVGIGLNNNKVSRGDATQFSTDCETIIGTPLDRNLLVARLIEIVFILHKLYEENNIPNISELWPKYSALIDQKVRLFSPFQEIIGTEVGLAGNGALMICDEAGTIRNYFSGELSLRPYA